VKIHGGNQQEKLMDIQKIIWLAGIFEGEGMTGLYKFKRRENGKEKGWRISTYFLIANNDPAIIWEIKNIVKDELGIEMYINTTEEDRLKNHNTHYKIVSKKMANTHLLNKTLLPYLVGTKKYVAKLTMSFIESRNFGNPPHGPGTGYSEYEENLYKECKEINQRGINKKKLLSSETIREALKSDDIVQTSMKIGEEIKE
jgi:hypothetical protein